MSENFIYKQAIKEFGIDAQVDMLIEEMCELTQALLKCRRRNQPLSEGTNLHEEFADVEIMMSQIRILMSENNIQYWKQEKLNRLQKLINDTP